jgi:hypothetical protein
VASARGEVRATTSLLGPVSLALPGTAVPVVAARSQLING